MGSRRIQYPTGMAPRSSITGSVASVNTTASSAHPSLRSDAATRSPKPDALIESSAATAAPPQQSTAHPSAPRASRLASAPQSGAVAAVASRSVSSPPIGATRHRPVPATARDSPVTGGDAAALRRRASLGFVAPRAAPATARRGGGGGGGGLHLHDASASGGGKEEDEAARTDVAAMAIWIEEEEEASRGSDWACHFGLDLILTVVTRQRFVVMREEETPRLPAAARSRHGREEETGGDLLHWEVGPERCGPTCQWKRWARGTCHVSSGCNSFFFLLVLVVCWSSRYQVERIKINRRNAAGKPSKLTTKWKNFRWWWPLLATDNQRFNYQFLNGQKKKNIASVAEISIKNWIWSDDDSRATGNYISIPKYHKFIVLNAFTPTSHRILQHF